MVESTRSRRLSKSSKPDKPKKPYDGFPLFPHANGLWAKKILGKLHYFGPWRSPDEALRRFQEERDDLYAGRMPRGKQEGTTVRELCNEYLNRKRLKLNNDELSPRSFADMHLACKRIVEEFGPQRAISDIQPQDFAAMEAKFPKTWGVIRRGREIQLVRSVFHFAMSQGLINTVVRFGDFKKASKKILRRHRAKMRAANGLRIFERDELLALLDGALVVGEDGPELVRPSMALRAMILLGANCALGNSDIAGLTFSALDLAGGWLNLARQKTGVERRCPLWPETVLVLKEVIAARPEPKDDQDREIVFLTHTRTRWLKINFTELADGKVAVNSHDAITKKFRKLLDALGMLRPGRCFYALRHGFQTVADETKDRVAVAAIMGHVDGTMSDHYRERISDGRLRAVADHVRAWLFN
jgi:integrase